MSVYLASMALVSHSSTCKREGREKGVLYVVSLQWRTKGRNSS